MDAAFTFSSGGYLIRLSVALARLKFDMKVKKVRTPDRVNSNTPSYHVQSRLNKIDTDPVGFRLGNN